MHFQRIFLKIEQLFGYLSIYVINDVFVGVVDKCPLDVGVSQKQFFAVRCPRVFQYGIERLGVHTFRQGNICQLAESRGDVVQIAQ